jgi:hypothetical protein
MASSTMRTLWQRALGLLGLLLLLASCGGGVDSGGTGSYATGPITGYGSIIVGGVHYDEGAAEVQDETGATRSRDDLRLGMVTEIHASAPMGTASMPSATASAVRFRSEIIGPVDAVDAATGSLTVLGQAVQIDPTTVFDARLVGGLAALSVGDVVEVFGQLDASAGRYAATRIEPRPLDTAKYKLRGLVTALNTVAKTLVIGGQTIDYGQVTTSAPLTVGQLLRVELAAASPGGAWLATSVEIGTRPLPDRSNVEVEGRITAFGSIDAFEVDGIPVTTSAATSFPDGRSGVGIGARVEVHGSSKNGTLAASKVEIKGNRTEPFEFSGTIQLLDSAARTFVMRGFTVHWSDSTRFESGTRASDLRNGRRAEVKGALSADGTRLEATFIHVEL